MILEVRHKTSYRYTHRAAFSQHLLRLTPLGASGQTVLGSEVEIDPKPEQVEPYNDMFGNAVHVATVSRPHGTLEIVATSRIDRAERSAQRTIESLVRSLGYEQVEVSFEEAPAQDQDEE